MSSGDELQPGIQLTNLDKSQPVNQISKKRDYDFDDDDIIEEEIDKALFVAQEFDDEGNLIEIYLEDESDNQIDLSTLTPKEKKAHLAAIKKKRADKAAAKKKEEDAKILENQIPVSIGDLFQFTDTYDKFCIFFGVLGAMAQGASMPVLSLYLGNLITDLNSANFMDKINSLCIFFGILAACSAFGGFLAMATFMYVAERQAKRLRNMYFHSLLRQEISWFDENNVGDVASRLTSYTRRYQEGIADKFAVIIANLFSFAIGLIIAFYRGWELTLILLAPAPIMVIISALFAQNIAVSSSGELGKYAQANTIALQSFESIRTVVSYQMEQFLIGNYNKYATYAYEDGKKKMVSMGAGIGAFYFIIFSIYGLGLFYGGYLIREGRETWPGGELYTGGSVLSIFYALLTAVMMLGMIGPNFSALASSQTALASILEVIHRSSKINPFNNCEENQSKLQITRDIFLGAIAFQEVSFSYPTRREVQVLNNFTFCFPANESIAMVGHSGCGKTSILQLIERFYDPDSGNIFIEVDFSLIPNFNLGEYKQQYLDYPSGPSPTLAQHFAFEELVHTNMRPNPSLPETTAWINLKDINISLWRQECVGLVNQAPVLWQGSIAENLRYGKPDATMDELIDISKRCNAHEFIVAKNGQYNFQIVENGANLSGGQKQRLSLSRSLLVPKKLVCFDEPTSMLDSVAEREVQKTIDALLSTKAFGSLTIAHRLSTIRSSNLIIVLKEGYIVETGTHDDLMALTQGGIYHSMASVNNELSSQNAKIVCLDNAVSIDDAIIPVAPETEFVDPLIGDVEGFNDYQFDSSDTDTDDENNNFPNGYDENNDENNNENNNENNHNNVVETVCTDIVGQSVVTVANHDVENPPHPDATEHSMSRAWSTTLKSKASTPSKLTSTQRKKAKDKKKRKKKELQASGSTRRFMKQALKHYWFQLLGSLIFGGAEGAVFPIYSWLMSRILAFYYLSDKDDMYSKVSSFCGWFVLLGAAAFVAALVKMIFLGSYAEHYVLWFRKKVFANLLFQEMGFHDKEENSSSILATKLAADTVFVRTLGADLYGQALTVLVTVISSFIIAFIADWKYTLLMMVIFPVLSCTGFVQFRLMTGLGSKSKKQIEKAGLVAVEGLRNIRIVSSFNAEQALYTRFALRQREVLTVGLHTAMYAGVGFGLTQFFLFGSYAVTLWVGSYLINTGQISFEDMLQIFFMVEMASMVFGQLLAQISNVDKSRAAISDLYQLLDRKSLYDARCKDGETPPLPYGKIEFKNVMFHYPTANQLPVLKGVSFTLDPLELNKNKNSLSKQELQQESQHDNAQSNQEDLDMVLCGCIGSSGSGKSTIAAQLLPQFYRTVQPGSDESYILPSPDDSPINIAAGEKRWKAHKRQLENKYRKHLHLEPRDGRKSGQILIDGHNVDHFNLAYLRQHIALVQQETQLFFGTIRENIIAGDETITEAEMIRAAKISYIHHIIDKLPKKYETILTNNNSLSGGQKARIGISRALARKNAKIIIMDESNAALDTITAKVIEKNLAKYCHNKVLIFIAHRLASIRFANKIIVLADGKIVENGTHDDLVQINDGIYSNLLKLQQ